MTIMPDDLSRSGVEASRGEAQQIADIRAPHIETIERHVDDM